MVLYAALAAYQIWSNFQQAQAISDQSELTKNISDMNARYDEIDAWEAEKHGYTEATRYQTVIDGTIGEQRAAYASANVDVSFGTAAEVQQESKLNGFLNQLDMQRQARAKSLGLKFEASNYRLAGEMQEAQGNAQASATRNAGIANGLGTLASGYGKYKSDESKAENSKVSTYGKDGSNNMVPMSDPFKQDNSLQPRWRLGDWNYKRNIG